MNEEQEHCLYCRGLLERRSVTRVQEYQQRWIVIENLPALVCRQCGETYYPPDVHDLVIRLISGQTEPVRIETIAVYDARNAA